MKINQGLANEISKWLLFVLLFVLLGGGFFLFGVWMIWIGEIGISILFLIYSLVWLCMMATGFHHSMAAVTLADEGVYFRVYIRTKFYTWDEIAQTGVLWSPRQYRHYNDLVLLPNTGSPRVYQDKTFALRNHFKLIHIPYTPDTLAYLSSHHGPLDFDLSDGKTETRSDTDESVPEPKGSAGSPCLDRFDDHNG